MGYGSGRFVGWFVLERLTERTLIQDAQGRTAARELDVELTQFVGDPNNPLPTPAVKSGRQNPLLSLLPESVRAQASDVVRAVEKGIKVYRAAESGIADMQNLIRAAKDLKNDPSGTLNLLGDALNVGGSTLGRLNTLPEVTAVFGDLKGAAEFAAQAGQAANRLGGAVGALRAGHEGGSVGSWLNAVENGVAEASDALANGSAAAQALTGYLAARKDK